MVDSILKLGRQCTYNATLWRFSFTIVTQKKPCLPVLLCGPTRNSQLRKNVDFCHGRSRISSFCIVVELQIIMTVLNNTNVHRSSCEVPDDFVQF
jgi:hypothetical protein